MQFIIKNNLRNCKKIHKDRYYLLPKMITNYCSLQLGKAVYLPLLGNNSMITLIFQQLSSLPYPASASPTFLLKSVIFFRFHTNIWKYLISPVGIPLYFSLLYTQPGGLSWPCKKASVDYWTLQPASKDLQSW